MPSRNSSLFERTWRILANICWIMIACAVIGIGANLLVKYANDGKMPVAMTSKDILFAIGTSIYDTSFWCEVELARHPRKQPLTEDMHFRFLADRILFSLTTIPPERLHPVLAYPLEWMKFPAGEEGVASIGDLLMYAAVFISLPLILLLWLLSAFSFAIEYFRK